MTGRVLIVACLLRELAAAKIREYDFDYVFGPATTQQQLFDAAIAPLIDAFVQGYNSTVFAYGQVCTRNQFAKDCGSVKLFLHEHLCSLILYICLSMH